MFTTRKENYIILMITRNSGGCTRFTSKSCLLAKTSIGVEDSDSSSNIWSVKYTEVSINSIVSISTYRVKDYPESLFKMQHNFKLTKSNFCFLQTPRIPWIDDVQHCICLQVVLLPHRPHLCLTTEIPEYNLGSTKTYSTRRMQINIILKCDRIAFTNCIRLTILTSPNSFQ